MAIYKDNAIKMENGVHKISIAIRWPNKVPQNISTSFCTLKFYNMRKTLIVA